MTAPGAGAAARLAVLDDHHVAELGPAMEERAVDDDASADAGAEREQHEVRDVAARSELELGVARLRSASFSIPTGRSSLRSSSARKLTSWIGMLTAPSTTPGLLVDP